MWIASFAMTDSKAPNRRHVRQAKPLRAGPLRLEPGTGGASAFGANRRGGSLEHRRGNRELGQDGETRADEPADRPFCCISPNGSISRACKAGVGGSASRGSGSISPTSSKTTRVCGATSPLRSDQPGAAPCWTPNAKLGSWPRPFLRIALGAWSRFSTPPSGRSEGRSSVVGVADPDYTFLNGS